MNHFARRILLGVLALFLANIAVAAETFEGQNCALADPPPEAGDIFYSVGKTQIAGKVYPRLSQITETYTGCQVLWSIINNGPRTKSLLILREGRVEAIEPHGRVPLCATGERTIDTGCSPRQRALLVSYPPGCAKRTVETGGVPKDCLEAFQFEFAIHDKLVE